MLFIFSICSTLGFSITDRTNLFVTKGACSSDSDQSDSLPFENLIFVFDFLLLNSKRGINIVMNISDTEMHFREIMTKK